ncbi:hypothetical protein [Mucilaginibacter psychrotolerans]|uniref:Uncharacterized protein n=1 Tax=Mucilaginibacter psychrotolerans TaxID=1524096 RepID=A0A4Y8S5B9_9SPHI|nr:hypothetical protein [Mucilaginibacter psychrotolerans]TFF33614.1 hypothetical protein E2R66_24905 [Mucilaginibacter psychrotolerans]
MEEKDLIPKREYNYKVVGINLVLLVGYTLLSAIPSDGIIIDAFFLFLHVLACIILSITGPSRLQWLLSGLLVSVIGFSTCTGILGRHGGI